MTKPRIRVPATSRQMLTVVPFRQPEPDGEIMSVLARFEERARDGQLVSIAIAGVNRDGAASTAYVKGPELFALMGVVQHLMRRVSSEVEIK